MIHGRVKRVNGLGVGMNGKRVKSLENTMECD
jgi:hypothetical protein